MRYLLLLVFVMVCSSCSSKISRALPKPSEFKDYVKGQIVKLEIRDSKKKVYQKQWEDDPVGEIIEVDIDKMTILTLEKSTLVTIPKLDIEVADIYISLSGEKKSGLAVWAGLVNFLSIGHGWYAPLSLVVNLVSTISTANSTIKGAYLVNYPETVPWEELYKFSRFPQGIPSVVDRATIR